MPGLNEEREKKKRAIFDGMSPKRQQKIIKTVGYENWDPFQEPRDPIDLREQKVEQMASVLFRQFIVDCEIKDYSNESIQAVKEISKGLIKDKERYKAMYDFCCWYEKTKGDSFLNYLDNISGKNITDQHIAKFKGKKEKK